MIKTLLIPLVTDSSSVVFKYNTFNCIQCVNAMKDIAEKFDEVYFIVHAINVFNCMINKKINIDMKIHGLDNFSFIILPKQTSSPAETIYEALQKIGVENRSIFIKDGDNRFTINDDFNIDNSNAIIISSLEKLALVDPIHKSYVKTDEQGLVVNCIEKRVISDKFIAGGYFFKNAKSFVDAYNELKKYNDKFYISDIIYWMILNRDEKFIPYEVDNFEDFNLR